MIYRVGPNKTQEQGAEEEACDRVHGEGFDSPVDEQGQAHRTHRFAGFYHFVEINFHHDWVHHEEQAQGDGYGNHRRVVDVDGHAVKGVGQFWRQFAKRNPGEDAQCYP